MGLEPQTGQMFKNIPYYNQFFFTVFTMDPISTYCRQYNVEKPVLDSNNVILKNVMKLIIRTSSSAAAREALPNVSCPQ